MGLRCFVAVQLPVGVKDGLCGLQRELVSCGGDVKWVERDNLHLTLRFLGDVEPGVVSRLSGRLRVVVSQLAPFGLEVLGAGAFPSSRKPRVLWVGVCGRDMPRLHSLFQAVEREVTDAGIPAEQRGLSPHITIGRIRNPVPNECLERELETRARMSLGALPVNRAVLYRSELAPSGPTYTEVDQFDLACGR